MTRRIVFTIDCPHDGKHAHGPQGYRCDGCRCDVCHAAELARVKANDAGRRTTVRAAHVWRHVDALRESGMSVRMIADASGVRMKTVGEIVAHKRPRVRRDTAAALLAVSKPARDVVSESQGWVDGTGTRRRLRALATRGWNAADLGQRSSVSARTVARIMRSDDEHVTVRAFVAQRVRETYDVLWNERPPSQTVRQRQWITNMTREATSRGWAPPLAWDEDTIDDPSAEPAAWERARVTSNSKRVHFDDVLWLARAGVEREEIARRIGVASKTIDSVARHHGRIDVLRAMGVPEAPTAVVQRAGRRRPHRRRAS